MAHRRLIMRRAHRGLARGAQRLGAFLLTLATVVALGSGFMAPQLHAASEVSWSDEAKHSAEAPIGQKNDVPNQTAHLSSSLQPALTRAALTSSLRLGRSFLLNCQLPNGSFRYHFNYLTQEDAPEQSPVRQAGALWGIALLHREMPSPETRQALVRGFDFFAKHSQRTPDGRRFIRFPGAADGQSGAVALVTLALIDFLHHEQQGHHRELQQQTREYLAFLESLERSDHRFHSKYLLNSGEGWGNASPYYDGEILLALAKASRITSNEPSRAQALRALAAQTAESAFRAYAAAALDNSLDIRDTKGYFQWACMAHGEMYQEDGPASQIYAHRTIQMAHWMIDVHKVAERRLNTAYALEGIIVAYHLAERTHDVKSREKFRGVIQQSLAKLATWQLGSSHPCNFLRQHPVVQQRDIGGILRANDSPWLRIDVAQHQMHAVILARTYVWPPLPWPPLP